MAVADETERQGQVAAWEALSRDLEWISAKIKWLKTVAKARGFVPEADVRTLGVLSERAGTAWDALAEICPLRKVLDLASSGEVTIGNRSARSAHDLADRLGWELHAMIWLELDPMEHAAALHAAARGEQRGTMSEATLTKLSEPDGKAAAVEAVRRFGFTHSDLELLGVKLARERDQVRDALNEREWGEAERGKARLDDADNGDAQPIRKKRSTIKGEAREKIIAGLTEHHGLDGDTCLNWEPIKVNEFADKNEVSSAAVSDFLRVEFADGHKGEGYEKYRAACNDHWRLLGKLKAWNSHKRPGSLFMPLPKDFGHDNEQ